MDTAGMHKGWMMVRWQGIPKTRTNGDGLVRDFRVVKVSDLPSLLPSEAMGITAAQRQDEREQRQSEWRLRIADGTGAKAN
jgi:hypothetical protein